MLQFRSGHLLGLRGDQHAMPMGCNDFAGDQGRAIGVPGVPRCRETHQTGGFSSFCFDDLWGIQSKGGENYGKFFEIGKVPHFSPCWRIFASLRNLEDTFSHSPLMRFHAPVESENRNVCFLSFCFIPGCQKKPQTFCGVWRPNFIRLHSETSYICSGFIQI